MHEFGQNIVKQLLIGLMELRSLRVVLRDIEPLSISISDDMAKINFLGLTNIVVKEKNPDLCMTIFEPYCPAKYPEFRKLGTKNFAMDKWSVGIIIIEIICGTEFALPLKTWERTDDMLDILQDYLDWST